MAEIVPLPQERRGRGRPKRQEPPVKYTLQFTRQQAAYLTYLARVKGLLKAELKKKNVSYRQLAERLTAMGVPETEANIANKISRGGFTAVFFVQCLAAIGAHTIRLHEPE